MTSVDNIPIERALLLVDKAIGTIRVDINNMDKVCECLGILSVLPEST